MNGLKPLGNIYPTDLVIKIPTWLSKSWEPKVTAIVNKISTP